MRHLNFLIKKYLILLIVKLSNILPDNLFISIVFIKKLKYIPNLRDPRSFNEKLNFIKLNKTNNYYLRCMATDRLKVREYVLLKSPSCNLVKILWHGKIFTSDVYKNMPNRFVIKASHGSGMVYIANKNIDCYEKLFLITQEYLQTDSHPKGLEWFYTNLDKYLIIEEFLEFQGDVPPDFKFFVFNGKVELVQVELNRFGNHTLNLYDRSFNKIDATLKFPLGYDIDKPKLFDQAKKIAEQLSLEFDFIRVDLYILEDKVYFGELTNTPSGGLEPFTPRKLDFDLGKKLRLQ